MLLSRCVGAGLMQQRLVKTSTCPPSLWGAQSGMGTSGLEQVHGCEFLPLQKQSWRKATGMVNILSELVCAYLRGSGGITAAGRGDPPRACRLLRLIRSIVPVCTQAGWPSLTWNHTSHTTALLLNGHQLGHCLVLSCVTESGAEQTLPFSHVRRSWCI